MCFPPAQSIHPISYTASLAFTELPSLECGESSGRAAGGVVLLPALLPQPGSVPGALHAMLEEGASLGLPISIALLSSTAQGREVTLFRSRQLLQHRRWLCIVFVLLQFIFPSLFPS